MRHASIGLISLCLFVGSAFANEVSFEARVSQTQIRPDDVVELEISLNTQGGDAGEIQFDAPTHFTILSKRPQTSTSASYMNGSFQVTKRYSLHIVLSPKKEGNLNIPPASVDVDGKTYRTQAFVIKVDAKAPQRKATRQAPNMFPGLGPDPMDPFAQMDPFDDDMSQLLRRTFPQLQQNPQAPHAQEPDTAPLPDAQFTLPQGDFFLKTLVSKQTVFKGEELTASYYIYVKEGAQLHQPEFTDLPKLNGFWKETVFQIQNTNQLNWEIQRVNGVTFRRALLLKFALFPLSTGQKNVDSLKINAHMVQRPSRRGYGTIFPRVHPYPRSSAKEIITVLPLPTEGQPKDFLGATGQFQLELIPPPLPTNGQQLKTNVAFSLKIKVTGRGNFNSIDKLPLQTPQGMEYFDTKVSENNLANGQKEKTFEHILIARQPGTFVIPPTALTYFDTQTKKYARAETQALQLSFEGAASNTPTEDTASPPPATDKAAAQDAPSAKPPVHTTLPSPTTVRIHDKALPVAATLIWALIPLVLGVRRWKNRAPEASENGPSLLGGGLFKRHRRAQTPDELLRRLGQKPPTPAEIQEFKNSILRVFSEQLAPERQITIASNSALSSETLLDQLEAAGAPPHKISKTRLLFNQLDGLRFRGSGTGDLASAWAPIRDSLDTFVKNLEGS